MPRQTRQLLKLFGKDGDAANFAQFGSKVAGSPIETKDIPTIQALSAWLTGLQSAALLANHAPFLEDMNGLFYVLGYSLAYVMQEGIPEWQTDTTYYIGSMVKIISTRNSGNTVSVDLYCSLTDSNTGNAPSTRISNGFWQYMGREVPPGTITAYAGVSIQEGYLQCFGQEVSRTGYSDLFVALGSGTVWGNGNGTTTFNIPDLRGRTLFGNNGAGTFSPLGATGGTETHTHTQAAHSHTVASHVHSISQAAIDHRHLTPIVARGGQTFGVATAPFGDTSPATGQNLATFQAQIGPQTGTTYEKTDVMTDFAAGNTGAAAPGTDAQTPVINSASSVNPFAVIYWVIKT